MFVALSFLLLFGSWPEKHNMLFLLFLGSAGRLQVAVVAQLYQRFAWSYELQWKKGEGQIKRSRKGYPGGQKERLANGTRRILSNAYFFTQIKKIFLKL